MSSIKLKKYFRKVYVLWGYAAAMRYKPEGCGFDSRLSYLFFHCLNLCGRNTALGSTQPLTDLSTKRISCGVKEAGS